MTQCECSLINSDFCKKLDLVIDFNQSIDFAIQIAKGMDFLYKLEPPIMTYDLNSKHVMIGEDLSARINMSDCRFSFEHADKVYTPAWMAPEALRNRCDGLNRMPADMWSFGVLLWELYTREVPFSDYSPMQCGLKIARGDLRLHLAEGMSSQMHKLIKICMNEDPLKRPKFEMIIPILEKLKK